HLNDKEEDGFLKALVRSRPDLAGVPFLMGGACRTKGGRAWAFKELAEKTRRQTRLPSGAFKPELGEEKRENYRQARLAAVAQILPGEEEPTQRGLIADLGAIRGPEATRELARAAVFSPEPSVRADAIRALAWRPPSQSTEVLVAGLRYPWPAVAENAA